MGKQSSPRDLRKIRVSWVDDVVMLAGQQLAERQVVLVNEEPGGQGRSRRQRAELLLVRDGGTDLLLGEVVAVSDLVDRLPGVEQLPEPLGRHPLHRRPTESNQRIDHHR